MSDLKVAADTSRILKYPVSMLQLISNYHRNQSVLPKVGPSLQAQEPRLQFCRGQVFHRKPMNQVLPGIE